MPDSKPDLYEILHIHPSAPPEVVRASYRQLALLYHPDKNPSPEATALMAQVNDAYAVLNDPEKRAAYDRERAAQARQATPPPDQDPQAGRNRPSTGYSSGTQTGYGTGVGFITLGSTKEDVLRIQGMPTDIEAQPGDGSELWVFGVPSSTNFGSIEFGLTSGRVCGWNNFNSGLRIRLVPGPNVTSYNFFEEGDHRDEVARLQGTPKVVFVNEVLDAEMWVFSDNSTVLFSHSTGLVGYWENHGTLKARTPQPGNRFGNNPPGRRETSARTGSSRWRRLQDKIDPQTRTRNVYISTRDPIDIGYGLMVRFAKRDLEIFVDWPTPVSYEPETLVAWQIDNGLLQRGIWGVGTSNDSVFMPASQVMETIRALYNAEELTVRVYPFGGNPLTANFQVSGFAEAVKPVLDAWRQAGSPAPGQVARSGGGCLLPVLGVVAVAVAVPVIVGLF